MAWTAVEAIKIKRDGQPLPDDAIREFVRAAAAGSWEDYQLTAMLMAIFLRGMSPAETAAYTREMTDSGRRIDLADIPGPKVDKHSTGGVGDKTSLILAPLAACCGVVVPMMSGRGLGHTGGTLDKLEAIPGYRVNLGIDEFKSILRSSGMAMIGQTADVAPADKKLYALRDVSGTVESIPLITASILSKKIAEGISGLVLDVKVGRGAFMKSLDDARNLAKSLVAGARANGLRCEALLTGMDAPLGRAVGNANEVQECIDTLKGHGPADLEELSVVLAARMVKLAGRAKSDAEAVGRVRAALASGEALDRFRVNVADQGGDPRIVDDPSRLPRAPHLAFVKTDRPGYIKSIDAELVGRAAMRLGAGRMSTADRIDPAVGIRLLATVGDRLAAGDAIFELAYRDEATLAAARDRLTGSYGLADAPPTAVPIVREEITT
jgi:pyrimidine-nucleoside phosphorylase